MQVLLNRLRFPGAEMIQSFIGRRILGAFSLIRTAILVMSVANILLFQYLDSAEVQERNKTAEQGTLNHLSFVVETQIGAYESAVWETGKLPGAVTSARDLYTTQVTADVLALRKLNPALLAPGGALHGFVLGYLQLNDFWRSVAPAVEQGADRGPLQAGWQSRQALIADAPQTLASYRADVAQEQQELQRAKANAKQAAIILSAIISFISFALSIVLAVVLTRQIVPPVNRLRDALKQVAEGDLSPQAAVRGRDEISQLLTTFNASIGRLRDLLVAVRTQALAISSESGRLKQAFAGEGLNPQEAAVLQDALAAAGRLARATDEVTALTGAPSAGSASASPPPPPVAPAPIDDGVVAPDALSEERARVLDELTHAVERISVRLGEVTTRADSLVTRVAVEAPSGDWVVTELRALDGDARAAAAQFERLIQDVRRTQRMTTSSVGNLDRAASTLHEAVGQFRLQG